MAAAAAQLQGFVNEQQGSSIQKWTKDPLFSDVPTEDGLLRVKQAKTFMHGIPRGGSSLGANVEGNDPGAGGGGNATVQAQHTDRNQASREVALSMISPSSNLYNVCSNAPFTTGRQIMDYLPTVVYLRIDDDVAQQKIIEAQSWTYLDMPVASQDESLVLNFKAKIQGYNPMLHPNMNISNQQKIAIFCNGLHPEAKIEAVRMKNNIALAQQNNCCFPGVYAPGHPLAGNVHPQAGNLSLDALAMYVHREFDRKRRAGLFRLKGQPSVNLTDVNDDASTRSVPQSDAAAAAANAVAGAFQTDVAQPCDDDGFICASWNDVWYNGFSSFYDYAVYFLNQQNGTRLRTCKNCGGVNHFSHKDGVLVCPTPEGSVNSSLLSRIRYPLGVQPWNFGKGKGKGKGAKGKGKGGRGYGGRGRGNYFWDDSSTWYGFGDDAPTQEPAQHYISDDFDGWNDP